MAQINWSSVKKTALLLENTSLSGSAPDFTSPDKFPPVGSEGVVDFIFAVTMLEFGSWKGNKRGYQEPVYGEVDGVRRKGSDLLWALSLKALKKFGPEFFKPDNLLNLTIYQFHDWIPDSSGYQDIITRYEMVLRYAEFFIFENTDPEPMTRLAGYTTHPLRDFVFFTSKIPGYNTDPLFKKNLLLALILSSRPENFLKVRPDDFQTPIVDTHVMRLALRLGLLNLDDNEQMYLSERIWMPDKMELEIRKKAFEAVAWIIEISGKPMREIDFLFWSARDYCPEMTEPECSRCLFGSVCQKRTGLFQPVFRTTNY